MGQKQAVFKEQENVSKEMAEKSNCIIVGRCADYILRDLNPYRIFVYSDMKSKVARCKEENEQQHSNMSDRQLVRHIKKIDRQRKSFYEFFTGRDWGNKLNYDICINTSKMNIEDIVPHLAGMFK